MCVANPSQIPVTAADRSHLQEVTLADLFHLPYGALIADHAGFKGLTATPNVARWWADISSRPSWNAVKGGA